VTHLSLGPRKAKLLFAHAETETWFRQRQQVYLSQIVLFRNLFQATRSADVNKTNLYICWISRDVVKTLIHHKFELDGSIGVRLDATLLFILMGSCVLTLRTNVVAKTMSIKQLVQCPTTSYH